MTERPPLEGLSSRLILARGARAAENALLADVRGSRRAGIPDPHEAPLRIVVPSEPLRLHISRRLVEVNGRAVSGVIVQTLSSFARETLELAGEAPLTLDRALFELLVRRAVSEGREPNEPADLVELLEAQPSASRAIAASARDLLDAGLGTAQAEAMREAIEHFGGADARRARALVATARRVRALIDGWGMEMPGPGGEPVVGPALARNGDRLARAAEHLRNPAGEIPASRAVLVHGFADATGVASDLLQALASRVPTRVYVDSPPPADEAQGGEAESFSIPFRERLALAVSEAGACPPARAAPILLEAPSVESEVRAVCERIHRELVDAGPDRRRAARSIGLVVRQPQRYAHALRRHLSRLGIPFDGTRFPASGSPRGRRAGALSELLQQGARTPIERWMDALGESPAFGASVEMRHALRRLGAGRLAHLAELDLEELLGERDQVTLGLPAPEDDPERAAGRSVARREIEAARALAVKTLEAHGELEGPGAVREVTRRLLSLLIDVLAWDPSARDSSALLRALEDAMGVLPEDLDLDRDELTLLVERFAASQAVGTLGTSGQGVRVSTVVDARGQTYGSLYVLGMNRDLFPRRISEDPLLLDGLRRVLARELPDLPIKTRGYDEERYLFDMLLASSERVTLSWARLDAQGKELARSALLSRIPGIEEEGAIEQAPPLHDLSALDAASGRPRTALEFAILAGLDGRRHEMRPLVCSAVEEGRDCLEQPPLSPLPEEVAEGLLSTAQELDESFAKRLGPYLGLVGEQAMTLLDAAPTHVTSIASILRCPWRSFLTRGLGLESTPDPLQDLPGADSALVGRAVHHVLQRIIREAQGADAPRSLEKALERAPQSIDVPPLETLERMVSESLERIARREGIALGPSAPLLSALAMIYLEPPWKDELAMHRVLGAEIAGKVATRGGRELAFRADRVDRDDQGEPLLIDFKTGGTISELASPDKVRRDMLRAMSRGASLQGAAYALGASNEDKARGRYVFLDPDAAPRIPNELEGRDDAVTDEFSRVVEAALSAWESGELPPRLEDLEKGKEPRACSSCEVSDACRRGESGARMRLVEWGKAAATEHEAGHSIWRVVLDRHEDAE